MTNNYINHIGFVLDASASMKGQERSLIRVTDEQVKYLAQRSKELDQETRATVYTFGAPGEFTCVYYDKDVLRVPSVAGVYKATGSYTDLMDSTMLAIGEMRQTATLHGDHAFLLYVLTDGQENVNRYGAQGLLERMLHSLPDNWTVAVLVPNQAAKFEAKKFGFPPDNIAIWDATSSTGVEGGFDTIRRATDNYMVARTQGVRSSKGLFQLDATKLSHAAVKQLPVIRKGEYKLLVVTEPGPIREFVETKTYCDYVIGSAYYQITKPEDIQPQKDICIRHRLSGDLYTGPNARQLLGLPDYKVKVDPVSHPDYDVFVQSTSVNRKLVPNTNVIVLS